jgi:hypothetical protein
MTTKHYTSADQIIEIVTTNDDARYPRHAAKMTVVKMTPKPNSRCRHQWGGISVMFTHAEIRALLQAMKSCDPTFKFFISEKHKNKPESRKQEWHERNCRRIAERRNRSRQ